MGVLAYRNIKEDELLEMKVVAKNGLFLIAAYAIIAYQYFSYFSFLMMGSLLIAIYIINMVLKVYE